MHDKTTEQTALELIHLLPVIRKNFLRPYEQKIGELSPMQHHILFHLQDGKPVAMSELAEHMKIVKQQLTFLLNKLEENHYIRRIHDKKDRRRIKISITQEGIEYKKTHQEQTLRLIIQKIETLSKEDQRALCDAILTISDIVRRME